MSKKIYIDNLISKNKVNKKIKAVVACGNGTAGVFAPEILRGVGCEVIELDCELDWSFQNIIQIQKIWRCFMLLQKL